MPSIPSIIETIDWEMSKKDLQNAFSYMAKLPPHPTQNAIGFSTRIFNIPSAVVCYFYKQRTKERLGAVNIMVYEEPPSAKELKKTLSKVLEDIKTGYGKPRFTTPNLTAWVFRGRVLQVSTTTGIIGMRFGDPKVDPPSAISIGREGDTAEESDINGDFDEDFEHDEFDDEEEQDDDEDEEEEQDWMNEFYSEPSQPRFAFSDTPELGVFLRGRADYFIEKTARSIYLASLWATSRAKRDPYADIYEKSDSVVTAEVLCLVYHGFVLGTTAATGNNRSLSGRIIDSFYRRGQIPVEKERFDRRFDDYSAIVTESIRKGESESAWGIIGNSFAEYLYVAEDAISGSGSQYIFNHLSLIGQHAWGKSYSFAKKKVSDAVDRGLT